MFDEYFQCKTEIAEFFNIKDIVVNIQDMRKEMWLINKGYISWGMINSDWCHTFCTTQTHRANGYVLAFNQHQGFLFIEDNEFEY